MSPGTLHEGGLAATRPHNRTLIVSALSLNSWRERAGRRIGSDYTAMERSVSQSGGKRKSSVNARNSWFADMSRHQVAQAWAADLGATETNVVAHAQKRTAIADQPF
ncbi:hypothetical protein AM571_PC01850 (plasmid) [Rhizobium etli 8C-3]|uniref:Uncharacterized protein n=1 Tax=Rhizobium etli 8C-3 TaxID=538025 RepID=A0A1L5PHR2_RHIET|nr:hypothetical protein AM571_PC01850 [Rhizobium etli 8C-3]